MAVIKYALEKGGPRRLEISCKGNTWKNVTIRLDGNEMGSFAAKKELEAGQEFPLGDGSALKVQLVQKKLRVLRDGQPLTADPSPQLVFSYGIIFFIAGLDIILGLVAELLQVEFLKERGIDYTVTIIGAIFLLLGFFVRRRSRIALGIAVGLYGLDGIISFIMGIMMGNLVIMQLVWHILFLRVMAKGFGAIRDLKQGW